MEHVLYKVYYDSPAGLLEFRGMAWAVTQIYFVDARRFPEEKNPPACFNEAIKQLKEYFEGIRQHFDFPYTLEGTGFQQRVWHELEKIPFGVTITYTEQTRRLGDMKAIRAVASANGKNPLAIVVPCHRVLGSNGKLTGYAGGLEKKRWLIEHERQFMQPEDGKLF